MQAKFKKYLVGLGVLGLLGCSGPIVKVEHRFPGAIGLPEGAGGLQAGEFAVGGYPKEIVEKFIRDALAERGQKINLNQHGSAPSEHPITVGGTVRVDIQDEKGTKKVRQGNPKETMEQRELAVLVRRVTVNCVFEMKDAQTLPDPILVELERDYDSSGDPRTRGELGLGRGDDPAGAVEAETLVKELIVQCIEDLCGMIRPVVVQSMYSLRGSLNSEAMRGAQAARRGDYPTAARHYANATQQEKHNPNLWFNLGVVTEAQGELSEARSCYEQAMQLSKDRDEQARIAAERVKKISGRMKVKI
jgi:hypothetical protein